MYSIAIDPASQGKGLGRAMMVRLLEQLQTFSAGRIYLEVEAANEPAMAMYRSLGFAAVRVLLDYYGTGRPGLSMRREAMEQSVFRLPA